MVMNKKRPKTFLGDFELTVLLAVLRLGEEAYGAAILREIEQRTVNSSGSDDGLAVRAT